MTADRSRALSTELAAVPADPAPAAVDSALLDGAVRFLQRAVHTSGLQLATQVSAYVIETFFAGDAAAMSSKDPHKTASFAALCAHPDLPMGPATLYGLVRSVQADRYSCHVTKVNCPDCLHLLGETFSRP
jgi:hypothetical protein